jgi:2'-5' RNA ligase
LDHSRESNDESAGAVAGSGSEGDRQLRLFYALWPDEAARTDLARLQSRVAGRRTASGNLHITLAFLGRQSAANLPSLRAILHGLQGSTMLLEMDRIGYFPRNRIAWAGMHRPPPALIELQRHLMSALEASGIAFDGKSSFRPHVTLARDAVQPADLPFDPVRWMARDIALVESDMQARGVAYRVLELRRLDANQTSG